MVIAIVDIKKLYNGNKKHILVIQEKLRCNYQTDKTVFCLSFLVRIFEQKSV